MSSASCSQPGKAACKTQNEVVMVMYRADQVALRMILHNLCGATLCAAVVAVHGLCVKPWPGLAWPGLAWPRALANWPFKSL